MILGIPVIRRYDLLAKLLGSIEFSSVKPRKVLVVDNGCSYRQHQLPTNVELIEPGRNVGVSGAWNLLAEAAGSEEIIISNDDIEYFPSTLSRILDASSDGDIVRAPGFALFMLKPATFQKVGAFDENFWPAYCEDNDYSQRVLMHGLRFTDPQGVPINHLGSASLHCLTPVQQACFGTQFEQLINYYRQKWGGTPGHEVFSAPFNGHLPAGWQLRPITQGGLQPDAPWLR